MGVRAQIEKKLCDAFQVTELTVTDESHLHAGHAGAREGGESHFRVKLISSDFVGLGRVERQRRVNHVLAEELAGPIHALALKLETP
ncbi:MAG: BolA family transcriptional regulator [Alphaproteobacteria bacterium]|nr:MAG: BolA family transcriptional regulator [Alphaproteobacteria bacterium]